MPFFTKNTNPDVYAGFKKCVVVQIVVQMKKAATKKLMKTLM